MIGDLIDLRIKKGIIGMDHIIKIEKATGIIGTVTILFGTKIAC